MAVVRDDDERALVVLQRFRQRFAHFDVEMVGRFIEQQQVRTLACEQRQREPRFFAAGELGNRRQHAIAAKIEAAEVVAQFLLAGAGLEILEMPERGLLQA